MAPDRVGMRLHPAGLEHHDRVENLMVDSLPEMPWEISVRRATDGRSWSTLGRMQGSGLPGDSLTGFPRRIRPRRLGVFRLPFARVTVSSFSARYARISLTPNWRPTVKTHGWNGNAMGSVQQAKAT